MTDLTNIYKGIVLNEEYDEEIDNENDSTYLVRLNIENDEGLLNAVTHAYDSDELREIIMELKEYFPDNEDIDWDEVDWEQLYLDINEDEVVYWDDVDESNVKIDESFVVGDRVRVTDGSGVDSGKSGVIVSRNRIKTGDRGVPTNISGAYRAVDWSKEVAIELDDGEIITMYKNRIKRIDESVNESRKGTYTGRNINTSDIKNAIIGKISGHRASGEPVYDIMKNDKKVGELSNSFIKKYLKESTNPKDKFDYVMNEFKNKRLHSSDGKIVTDRDQAIAIAYSESGLDKNKKRNK